MFLDISRFLLADDPVFAQVLASMSKVANAELKSTFALGFFNAQPLLYYHPNRLLGHKTEVNYLALLLKEELLHLVLQHPAKQKHYNRKWAYQLAAALEVVQWLDEETQNNRFNPLVKRLQLTLPWTLGALYERILQLENAHGQDQVLAWQMSSPLNWAAHQYWEENWSFSGIELQLWLTDQIQRLKKLFPTHSLWRQIVLESDEKLKDQWQLALQQFANNGSRHILKSSHRRPSKRYGTFPGTRRKRQQRLILIIDTSGSVEERLLGSFFQQVQRLHRQGAAITIIESDYKVRKSYVWNGRIPQVAVGGGHTDFDPALSYADESAACDGIIYFTDGKANRPSIIPRYPVLWMITDDGADKDWSNWPGRVVAVV